MKIKMPTAAQLKKLKYTWDPKYNTYDFGSSFIQEEQAGKTLEMAYNFSDETYEFKVGPDVEVSIGSDDWDKIFPSRKKPVFESNEIIVGCKTFKVGEGSVDFKDGWGQGFSRMTNEQVRALAKVVDRAREAKIIK